MAYWQISAGSEQREYHDVFIKYGIAFIGEEKAMNVMADDILVLKKGVSSIVAVGRVVSRNGMTVGEVTESNNSELDWLLDFDGWRLSKFCFIDWHVPEPSIAVERGLTMGTLKALYDSEVVAIADSVLRDCKVRQPQPLPKPSEKLSLPEILNHLLLFGLSPKQAVELTATIERIQLLANYYYKHCTWEDVREHETRTFLVIPLLLALGWSEQQLKIELQVPNSRGRIDIACFRRPYHRDNDLQPNNDACVLLIESKGFSQGLTFAPDQAQRYASQFNNCKTIVVSNGYVYVAYQFENGEWREHAYLNLTYPKRTHPYKENVKGGLELIELLLPRNS